MRSFCPARTRSSVDVVAAQERIDGAGATAVAVPGLEEATRGRTGRAAVVQNSRAAPATTNPSPGHGRGRRHTAARRRRHRAGCEGPLTVRSQPWAPSAKDGRIAPIGRRTVAPNATRTTCFPPEGPSHASHVPHCRHRCRRRRPHALRLRVGLDEHLARRGQHALPAPPLRVVASTRPWRPRCPPRSRRPASSSSAPTLPTRPTRCSPTTARRSRAWTSTSSTPSPPSSASRRSTPNAGFDTIILGVTGGQVRHRRLALHHQRGPQEAGQHGELLQRRHPVDRRQGQPREGRPRRRLRQEPSASRRAPSRSTTSRHAARRAPTRASRPSTRSSRRARTRSRPSSSAARRSPCSPTPPSGCMP